MEKEEKRAQVVSEDKELMYEWDWDLNNEYCFDPDKLSCGSQKTVFWICRKHNNKYKQIIRDKKRGRKGCSICKKESRKNNRERYIKGKTILAKTNPELIEEWISCEDASYTPYTCLAGSNIKVKWKCKKCGGEYDSYVSNRAKRGVGCPYCANQKVLSGYNDLQTLNPLLAEEWSNKNNISPKQITLKSNKKVYWKCKMGHDDYLSSAKQRSNGQGCPVCAMQLQTSFPEQAIFYYIKKLYPDAINRYKYKRYEIDIFIPKLNLGIEYNGYFYHRDKYLKDKNKKEILTEEGIQLIVIKEYNKKEEMYGADYYIDDKVKLMDLSLLIKNVILDIDPMVSIDIDCEKDMISIREQYITSIKNNSIAATSSEIAKEWDSNKNGNIKPEFITRGSCQKYYWICHVCGYSYLASPKSRFRGRGCPACCKTGRHIVVTQDNNFETCYPELLKYWNYEKNSIKPNEIYAGGDIKVYWKCERGHDYLGKIRNRIKGQGCPYCSGKKVLQGFNDLLSQKPEIADEWDYELNECKPEQIHFNNQSKKIHWVCKKCGYKWVSKVSQRIGCPQCNSKKKQINVYNLADMTLYASFEDAKSLCEHFNLNYKNQHGNISSICQRKQKTLMNKYVLRHASDDEFSF